MKSSPLLEKLVFRIYIISFFIVFLFLIFILRFLNIQAFNGDSYYNKAEKVVRKVVILPASRGEIYDRNYLVGRVYPIVSNQGRKILMVVPSHFVPGELEVKLKALEILFQYSEGILSEKVLKNISLKTGEKITLIENLSEKEATLLADYFPLFSKFIVGQSITRYYNLANMASHITGYIGAPTTKDIELGVHSYQIVGKNGIELLYDDLLRGEDGEIIQLKVQNIDSTPEIEVNKPSPGHNLVLTIDSQLQQIASEQMESLRGAIVILRPSTGEVLAFVSKPDYNPNILVSGATSKRLEHLEYIKKMKAELNRVISTKYSPASTFKTLVALAALEEGRVNQNQSFFCPGKFVLKSTYEGLDDTVFHDWERHSKVSLKQGIVNSCSVYFYKLGYMIGPSLLIKYANYFQLDKKTNIDLPGEITGLIPSRTWKEKTFNQHWFDGDTINLSIGQGFLSVTVLSMTNFYAAVANNGVLYKPHVVKALYSRAETNTLLDQSDKTVLYAIPLEKENLNFIKKSLLGVTRYGTAYGSFGKYGVTNFAGKTGTVQVDSNKRLDNKNQHAWFIGFGPTDRDVFYNIVIGVFIEKGIAGSVTAAPIVRKIYLHWLDRLKKEEVFLD